MPATIQYTTTPIHHYVKCERTVISPEDGGNKVFRNVGTLPHHDMTSQLRLEG